MSKKSCLNCGKRISDEFCPHCGQKSDTGRITLRTMIKNDILGSIWHVEARFFHSLKDILIRPGKMAMDYISGKRIKYYNFFSLILVLFGFNLIGLHLYEKFVSEDVLEATSNVRNFFSKYSKAVLFAIIPVLAINSWFLFKRMNLNLAEHIIIATVAHLGVLILFLLDDVLSIIGLYKPLFNITEFIDKFLFAGTVLFPAYTCYNAFSNSYTKLGLMWRILVLYIIMGIEVFLFVLLYMRIFK